MKLNLKPFVPVASDLASKSKKPDLYASPIGWWRVTTEGDCEGHSQKDLGNFFGHAAEIAFHLADKSFYSLQFSPIESIKFNQPIERPEYQATANSVWFMLDIESNTWRMEREKRAEYIRSWFDTKDVIVKPDDGRSYYFASVYLELNLD